VTNEPARVACGAPDYILTHDGIPIGFIEAKDIGDSDLEGKKANKEQFDRYKSTHEPFIFTDYLDFHFYTNGEFITQVRIAEIIDGKIEPIPGKFDQFKDLIIDFATQGGQTIRSAAKLSRMMAGKARLLSTIIENALKIDKAEETGHVSEPENTTLREQLAAFRNVLMHDIDAKKFADTSKTTVKVNTDIPDKRSSTGYKQIEQEVHKVQILDPAAGAGTFLAEVIKQIYTKFEGQEGIWRGYVENHLIPRLNGFEILMASYAMAHLKLDMLLREIGVEREPSKRFRVYLTNSLEEHHPDTGTLFAGWLSHEANEANHVKRDTPVMVVMGNPPYSLSSVNKGNWIEEFD